MQRAWNRFLPFVRVRRRLVDTDRMRIILFKIEGQFVAGIAWRAPCR